MDLGEKCISLAENAVEKRGIYYKHGNCSEFSCLYMSFARWCAAFAYIGNRQVEQIIKIVYITCNLWYYIYVNEQNFVCVLWQCNGPL